MTWSDEGSPWADLRAEQVVLNADLRAYIEADGPSGLIFRFRDKGAVGVTTGVATVDARVGPDVVEKVLEFELTATVAEADQLDGEFREQQPDAPPTPEAVPLSG